jgi:hypothetical protein
MFVRLLQGSRAGEIVEMKFMDAQPLLNDGRARRLDDGDPPVEAGAEAFTKPPGKPAATPKSAKKGKR